MAAFTKWVDDNKAARGHGTAAMAVGQGICDSDQDRNARLSACENGNNIQLDVFPHFACSTAVMLPIALEALIDEIVLCPLVIP